MKKAGLFIISFLLLVSIISFSYAQQDFNTDPGVAGIPDLTPEKIQDTQQNISAKWQYLGKEWKNIALKNPVVGVIDKVLTKISFVFRILLGEDYSLSLRFLLVIVLWIAFFMAFSTILSAYSTFSTWVAYVAAALLNVVFAQIGAFGAQANFFAWLAFGDKPWWFSLIINIIIFAILGAIIYVSAKYSKQIKKAKHAQEISAAEGKIKLGAIAGEALSKAITKGTEE